MEHVLCAEFARTTSEATEAALWSEFATQRVAMTQYWTKIKLMSAVVALFFWIYPVAYGESNPEIHLSIVSPESGQTIAQKVSRLEGTANRLEFTEHVQYYKTFCDGSPVSIGVAKLLDKVSISQIGKETYEVDVKISKVRGYREQNESITIPGSYFMEMCQVYEPQIKTRHRYWRVREQKGAISFSKQLNDRMVKVFSRGP